MKNLFKTALFAAVGALVFVSCNKKDNFDYAGEALKQEKAIDSIFTKDRNIIAQYIDGSFQEDSLKITYNYLDKDPITRGIWYKVVTTPTEEDDKAYDYKINSTGYGLPVKAPKVTLKYTARLLNGPTLEEGTLVENETKGEYDFGTTSSVINTAWYVSFFPYNIRVNEQNTRVIGGLTKNGLKKGSRIIVVTSSYWAYNTRGNGVTGEKAIPANSPLVYDFEVIKITE